jgi:hypothetical protein
MKIPFPSAPARPAIAAARLVIALGLVATLAVAAAAVPAPKTAPAPAAFHTRKVAILIDPGVEVLATLRSDPRFQKLMAALP